MEITIKLGTQGLPGHESVVADVEVDGAYIGCAFGSTDAEAIEEARQMYNEFQRHNGVRGINKKDWKGCTIVDER